MIKNKKSLPAGRQGFSLFELLVSISIIGILVAIVSISYSSAQKKARDARRIQDLNMVQKAAEQYYSSRSYVYPPDGTWGVGSNWDDASGNDILGSMPGDPKDNSAYSYHPDTNGAPYTNYCLCAALENPAGNSSSSHCNWLTNGTYYCIQQQQ